MCARQTEGTRTGIGTESCTMPTTDDISGNAEESEICCYDNP